MMMMKPTSVSLFLSLLLLRLSTATSVNDSGGKQQQQDDTSMNYKVVVDDDVSSKRTSYHQRRRTRNRILQVRGERGHGRRPQQQRELVQDSEEGNYDNNNDIMYQPHRGTTRGVAGTRKVRKRRKKSKATGDSRKSPKIQKSGVKSTASFNEPTIEDGHVNSQPVVGAGADTSLCVNAKAVQVGTKVRVEATRPLDHDTIQDCEGGFEFNDPNTQVLGRWFTVEGMGGTLKASACPGLLSVYQGASCDDLQCAESSSYNRVGCQVEWKSSPVGQVDYILVQDVDFNEEEGFDLPIVLSIEKVGTTFSVIESATELTIIDEDQAPSEDGTVFNIIDTAEDQSEDGTTFTIIDTAGNPSADDGTTFTIIDTAGNPSADDGTTFTIIDTAGGSPSADDGTTFTIIDTAGNPSADDATTFTIIDTAGGNASADDGTTFTIIDTEGNPSADEGTTFTIIDTVEEQSEDGTTFTIIDLDNQAPSDEDTIDFLSEDLSAAQKDSDDIASSFFPPLRIANRDLRLCRRWTTEAKIGKIKEASLRRGSPITGYCDGPGGIVNMADVGIQVGTAWFTFEGTGQTVRASTCPNHVTVFRGDSCENLECSTLSHDQYGCEKEWLTEVGKTYFVLVQRINNEDDYGATRVASLALEELDVIGPMWEDTSAEDKDTPVGGAIHHDHCRNAEIVTPGNEVVANAESLGKDFEDECRHRLRLTGFDAPILGAWFAVSGTGDTLRASACPYRITVFRGSCDNLLCAEVIENNGFGCEVEWTSSENGQLDYILVQSLGFEDEGGFVLPITLSIEDPNVTPDRGSDKPRDTPGSQQVAMRTCSDAPPIKINESSPVVLDIPVDNNALECSSGLSAFPASGPSGSIYGSWFTINIESGKVMRASACPGALIYVYDGDCGDLRCVNTKSSRKKGSCEVEWQPNRRATQQHILVKSLRSARDYDDASLILSLEAKDEI